MAGEVAKKVPERELARAGRRLPAYRGQARRGCAWKALRKSEQRLDVCFFFSLEIFWSFVTSLSEAKVIRENRWKLNSWDTMIIKFTKHIINFIKSLLTIMNLCSSGLPKL